MYIYTFIVLIIPFLVTMSAGDLGQVEEQQSCALPDDQEDKCSTICYPTIKPLLKHVALCNQNNEIILKLQGKIREQEIEINRLKINNEQLNSQLREATVSANWMDQLKEALDHNRNIMSEINKKIIKADDLISHSKLKEIANETEGFQVNCSAEDQDLPSNCLGFENGEGIRQIKVPGAKKFYVMCDSKTAGPGWTVVLRNLGNENFNRNWTSYKNGFGSMDSSFFVGLSRLHLMTQSQPHELFIAIYFKHPLHSQFTNSFDNFIVGGASQGYRLESIGNPTSSHFPFIQSQVKAKFTTFDSNNAGTKINYARGTAGWWFTAGNKQSLTQWQIGYEKTLMLIRPKMYL